MLVETYEIQEVSEQLPEQSEECLQLVTELGLEGQGQFYKASEDGGVASFPYRKMTAQERVVIKAICTEETEIGKYNDGPIPLRVLQVAAHAKALMDKGDVEQGTIVVWHPENADEKDPYLVLRIGPQYSPRQFYLLARWGEELENFNVMIDKAKKILTAKRRELLEGILAEVNTAISTIESTINSSVLTGKLKNTSFHNY